MDRSRKGYLYRHESKEEMTAFTEAYLMSACMKNSDPNVYKLYSGGTTAASLSGADRLAANIALFAEIIGMCDCHPLVITLSTLHKGDGVAALQHIKDDFSDGDSQTKENNAFKTYYKTIFVDKITADLAPDEFQAKCNIMHTCREELKSGNRKITGPAHAETLLMWISDIDAEYKFDVQRAVLGKDSTFLQDPVKIQQSLTTVIRARYNKRNESEDTLNSRSDNLIKTLKTKMKIDEDFTKSVVEDPDLAKAFKLTSGTQSYERKFEKMECSKCGEVHWVNKKNPESCITYQVACGKTPDSSKYKNDSNFRKMIDDKADALKKKLKGKDAKIAVIRPTSPSSQSVTQEEPVHTHLVLKLKAPPKVKFADEEPSTIYVDSQGGVGFHFHFIKDRHLFDHLDDGYPPVSVGGVVKQDSDSVRSAGRGTCTVDVLQDGEKVTMTLSNCIYVPDLEYNIFNVWHAFEQHGVRSRFEDDKHIYFKDGSKVAMLWDYTLRVVKHTPQVMAVQASVINRGKHGKLHIDPTVMSPMAQAKFDLSLQQLNDPASDRAKSLHKVMDNVPEILGKANYNNTATDSRMLANGPAHPAPESEMPMADRVGALTQIDGWDAGVVSLLGNRYMLDCIDSYSTDIEIYFAKKKSEFPDLVDRYFLEMLRDDPDAIAKGGVLYSDNEAVLTSQRMKDIATKHKRTTETSIQYRATTNAAAETGFRLVPNEMRKIYVRTGVPKEFWEFVANEARRILRWTRIRGDKTPGELRTGKRADFNKFTDSTFGCRVIARIPVPWRQDKHVPRSVSGVNLGKARNQPGYHIWCAEYGFMTSSDVTFFQHVFPFKTGAMSLRGAQHATGGGAFFSRLAGAPPAAPGGPPPPPGGNGGNPPDDDGDGGGGDDSTEPGSTAPPIVTLSSGLGILHDGQVVVPDDDDDSESLGSAVQSDHESSSLGSAVQSGHESSSLDSQDYSDGRGHRLDDENPTNSDGSYSPSMMSTS